MGHCGFKMAPRWPKRAPRGAQEGPIRPQDRTSHSACITTPRKYPHCTCAPRLCRMDPSVTTAGRQMLQLIKGKREVRIWKPRSKQTEGNRGYEELGCNTHNRRTAPLTSSPSLPPPPPPTLLPLEACRRHASSVPLEEEQGGGAGGRSRRGWLQSKSLPQRNDWM